MSEEQKLTGSPAARGRNALVVLLPLCLAFGALYRQMPLFTSNQNTKFLHGAANAHWRFLADDWTARTVDPLPVFSWCAEFVFRLLPVQFFLILFSLLIALYAFAMVRIAEKSAREAAGGTAWALFAALFAALHFTPLNTMLLEGVARQYVLGSYLQPSTFGILIYVAILLFLHGRDIVGALCLVGATLLHPGAYTIVSLLVLAVALHTNSAGAARRRAALPALLFLLCVLPLGIYYVAAFRPSSPESWRLAADILAHERIPHHTQIVHWLTYKEVGRMLFSATVCWSMRHNRLLFRLQLSLIAFAVLSTLLAYLLQNSALLLLAPWRVTAILLPLSFALAAHRLGVLLARSPGGRESPGPGDPRPVPAGRDAPVPCTRPPRPLPKTRRTPRLRATASSARPASRPRRASCTCCRSAWPTSSGSGWKAACPSWPTGRRTRTTIPRSSSGTSASPWPTPFTTQRTWRCATRPRSGSSPGTGSRTLSCPGRRCCPWTAWPRPSATTSTAFMPLCPRRAGAPGAGRERAHLAALCAPLEGGAGVSGGVAPSQTQRRKRPPQR